MNFWRDYIYILYIYMKYIYFIIFILEGHQSNRG